jgi:hypothetical protein
MPKQPKNDDDVLKQLQLNRKDWADLQAVADAYRVSRTDAVNRAIKWMVTQNTVPGFIKKETTV